jgi:hypothetical protein
MRRTLSCIGLLLLIHTSVNAQHFRGYHGFDNSYHSASELGRHEIRLGIGILSTDQIKGIHTRYQTQFDFPKTFSTAITLGYRYHLLNWLAIGLTAAADYQAGNTTNYSKTAPILTTGTYDRCSWSGALGLTFTYVDEDNFQMYGGLEGAYTLYRANTYFDAAYYNSNTTSGYNPPRAGNPLHVQDTYPSWQLTGLGLKSNGPFSFFFELGYGYRGMLVIGISGRL